MDARIFNYFWKICLIILSSSLIVACFNEGAPAPRVKKDSVDVRTIQVQAQDLKISETLPGRTVAIEEAQIRPRIDGIIIKKFFTEGQKVKKGDPLYEIDPRLYKTRLESAKAQLQQAKASFDLASHNLKRYEELYDSFSVSEEELEDAKLNFEERKASLASAKSALNEAQLNLEYTKVLSPITGLIGISNVPLGALVTSNQQDPLTTVINLDKIYVDLEQNALAWQNLRKMRLFGTLTSDKETSEVTLYIDNEEWPSKGELISFNPLVDEASGSVTLRAIFDNSEHLLVPGLAVDAKVMLGVNPFSLVIPTESVVRTARGQTFVYLISSDSRVIRREVQLGLLTESGFSVLQGLKEGDEIVVEGQSALKDGALVKIVNLVEPLADEQ